jgi:hypothetical protein
MPWLASGVPPVPRSSSWRPHQAQTTLTTRETPGGGPRDQSAWSTWLTKARSESGEKGFCRSGASRPADAWVASASAA